MTPPKGNNKAVFARPVILDITRLVRRSHHPTPTGIDRVEYEWADFLCKAAPRQSVFQAFVPVAGRREFSVPLVAQYLKHLAARWQGRARDPDWRAVMRLLRGSTPPGTNQGADCLSLSHQMLHDAEMLERKRPNGGRLFIFLHDVIPSDFPEYAREGGGEKHDLRVRHSIEKADGIIVNSMATEQALGRFLSSSRSRPMLKVAPLGVSLPQRAKSTFSSQGDPYFLCVGTIEPRKNHMLLLHVWRQMAQDVPAGEVPRLILVGRRGWENENIVDLLERSRLLKGVVEERGGATDKELQNLLSGARALLMPSFAEGYGLPVAEALSAGLPVIASTLPAFREIAGDVPDYLDPLDGPGWKAHILDYAAENSSMRAKQVERLKYWQPPTWDSHFSAVIDFLNGLR